ncbi:MAG: 3-methyl-2-oxobutanoate hydroxymethyltransferase [bacterium]
MKKTIQYLQQKKQRGEKITMLTCYDYPTAQLEEKVGIDIIFVGDSVGTNVLGYENETLVTMDDMLHHLKAVRRGVKNSYLLADMPYKTYENIKDAEDHAKLFIENGADGIKLEGFKKDVIEHLSSLSIEITGHLGLTPQTVNEKKVQGSCAEEAIEIINNSIELEKVGLKILVLESVPERISEIITKILGIPVIGIAAGRYCDGQVQVVNDILGINVREFRHIKKYENLDNIISNAFCKYRNEVEEGIFPQKEHVFLIKKEELAKVKEWVNKNCQTLRNMHEKKT